MKLPAALQGFRTARQLTGEAGETQALAYLTKQGFTLVERNFHCRGGEIDLIVQKNDLLVFVEVRKRANAQFGGAAASVVPAKQARLKKAAQLYLQRYADPPACRFDVIAIDGEQLNWIVNAIEE
ncbi:MAG: YraN family protein [Burkholderiaceae bacterium]